MPVWQRQVGGVGGRAGSPAAGGCLLAEQRGDEVFQFYDDITVQIISRLPRM